MSLEGPGEYLGAPGGALGVPRGSLGGPWGSQGGPRGVSGDPWGGPWGDLGTHFGSQNDLKMETKTGLESERDSGRIFDAKMELSGSPKWSKTSQKPDQK